MKHNFRSCMLLLALCALMTVLCTAHDIYPNSEGAYEYTYTSAEPGKTYTVLLLKGIYTEEDNPSLDPTGSNILYYSFETADTDGTLSLSIRPQTRGEGTVYISGVEKPILLFYARVSGVLFGDVNGDGSVNVKDNMFLSRYLAGWDGYDETTLHLENADLNDDGKVNVKDNMILARHLATWSGYETLPIKD